MISSANGIEASTARSFDLPFDRLDAIEGAITVLENLVAVFSQKHSPRQLHVYLGDEIPECQSEGVRVITLANWMVFDLEDYDGLVVGFPALELLREDLITAGVNFYPIEQIYRKQGAQAELFGTQARLAVEIVKRVREDGEGMIPAARSAAEAQALLLALPFLLQSRDCTGLAAVLPDGELNRFLLRKRCRFISCLENGREGNALTLTSLRQGDVHINDGWVIAFEELAQFHRQIQPSQPRFLELRSVLRSAGKYEELQQTRKMLAEAVLAEQARMRERGLLAERTAPYRPSALALLAEYWLAFEDVDDLVAYCPSDDLEQFARTGDAVRVYRTLDSGALLPEGLAGGAMSLAEFTQGKLSQGYQNAIFTFPLMRMLTDCYQESRLYGLSDILWKLGATHTLGRGLWLLCQDLVTGAVPWSPMAKGSLRLALDTSLRACLLYSLSDPWQWRQGRWGIYIDGCYGTLLAILRLAAGETSRPLALYYKALSAWYGCSREGDPEPRIREMLECLREFERLGREHLRIDESLRGPLADARQLSEAAESLLRLTQTSLVLESKPLVNSEAASILSGRMPVGLRWAASFSEPVPLLSQFFQQVWAYLLVFRRKRQHLHRRERDIDSLIRQLEAMRKEIRTEGKRLFGPLHERTILLYAFQQEALHIKALLDELETSARIAIDLRNPWVDLHNEVNLTLDVINQGRVEAETLVLTMDPIRGITALDDSPVREIMRLSPGESRMVHYRIRPERAEAELHLEYSFHDRRGQIHKDTWPLRLNVRSLDEQPFTMKVNRYQFGRPIQEPTEFYGRRKELQNILAQLIAGGKQNLLMRGPRRMGKTSLLYMLRSALTNPGTRRFFSLPESWDEKLDRVHPVFLSLHAFDLSTGGEAVTQFFRTILEQTAQALRTPEEVCTVVFQRFVQREGYVGAVNAALEGIGALLDRAPDERIIVLLDEYDEVYRPQTSNFDRHLREFVSAEQRITWIIASTLALFREVKTTSSPWFNVFSILELSLLPEEAAVALVEAPGRSERVIWRSDAVLTLLSETGRHPAYTQLFCAKVIAHLNAIRTNYVLADTILTLADELVDEQETANSHFEFYWQDTSGMGQLILLILDASETPLKRGELREKAKSRLRIHFGDLPAKRSPGLPSDSVEWQEEQFKNGMEYVEKIVNAIMLDSQRRYVFTVPLFRRWLRRRYRFEDLQHEVIQRIAQEMENDGLVYGAR